MSINKLVSPAQREQLLQGLYDAAEAVRPIFENRDSYKLVDKSSSFDIGLEADSQAEKIIIESIASTGLHALVIAEESGRSDATDFDVVVYIDPIDGTVNFAHGIADYCHTLAVYTPENEPLFAATYDPSAQEMFTMVSGEGLFLNGESFVRPSLGNLHPVRSIEVEWFGAPNVEAVTAALLANGFRPRFTGSCTLDITRTVFGRGSGAVQLLNYAWDVAAGLAMAKEAGLVATKLDGSAIDLFNYGRQDIIVAEADLHAELLAIVQT